nr:Gag-Pol polyprotein [Tanacetum cinerariifolium]
TDNELTEKEIKQIEADDQAIQTILLGLSEDIYAAVDSCETAQEIWLRVQQLMKGSDIGIQEKKAKLFNEWERKYCQQSQKEVDELKAERLAKTQDPLALMANSNNPYAFPAPHQDPPSFNQNYMQQPMRYPEDITDSTTAINMALALMAKAFKLNYSTPTNNNQRISSNPRNLNGYNAVQNVRNQVIQNVAQNPRVQNTGNQNGLIGVPGNANQNGNGNLVAARVEGNAAGHNGNQIRCYNCRGVGHFAWNCMVRPRKRDAAYLQTQLLIAQKEEAGIQLQAEEFDLMAAAADLDEIKKVNANYVLMANLQQASTSGTQTDKAPVYDSDGLAEVHDYENCNDNEIFNMFTQEEQYTKLLKPISEPHQVPQNDNNVISEVTSMEQSAETVEQHPANVEETRALYDSLYQNLAIKVEKVNTVNRKLKETNAKMTTELARFKNQEKCFEISQEKYDKLERKSKRASHPPKPVPNSRQRLHLLHMDLYGPMRIASINGKQYVLVIVDDYSRYTWVHFLISKDKAPEVIKTFLKRITILLQSPVIIIRTDNGTELKNQVLKEYFDSVDFSHAPLFLWAEAIATACFTQNRSIIHHHFNKTPYELINGKKPDISFLHVFRALCYPKNDHEDIRKLGAKGDIGFFIGFSANSCAYRVFNRRTKKIMETMNVSFEELSAMAFKQRSLKLGLQSELDLLFEAMYDDYIGGQPSATARSTKDHPLEQVIGEPSQPVLTRNQLRSDGDMCMYALTVSTMEPKNVKEAMTDPAWIESMQEELLQFKRLDEYCKNKGIVPTEMELELEQSQQGSSHEVSIRTKGVKELKRIQDDMIRKINLLWEIVSKKLNGVHISESAKDSMASENIATINHIEKEELRRKGIKSPSKLFSLKYLSSTSIIELDKDPSNPKCIHFVNSIIILSEESEAEQGETTIGITPEHNHNIAKEAKDAVKEVIDEEESKVETNEET